LVDVEKKATRRQESTNASIVANITLQERSFTKNNRLCPLKRLASGMAGQTGGNPYAPALTVCLGLTKKLKNDIGGLPLPSCK
jgi:hypothetical protein